VRGDDIEAEEMEVFASGELKGMDVDGVWGTAEGNHLAVVVFVDKAVESANVKQPME
jgi:hypothetical protein